MARQLRRGRDATLFSETLASEPGQRARIGAGDVVDVTIWEAPPATLFAAVAADARSAIPGSRATPLPEQVVDRDGNIWVPFVGAVNALGRTSTEVSAEIVRRLTGKANQPDVLVRVVRNASSTVAVVGEVATSIRLPLTPSGERLLDAIAAAGGVRQPVGKVMVQVTRGQQYQALPLDQVIRDPRQNILLKPGDVVTALFQPLSFTSLGATGRNEEIAYEGQGITLAQALARAGGLVDTRSDARGVFVFRLEREAALDWPRKPVATTPDGRVPVVYRFDLKNPNSFFVMQTFAINDKDVLYVSNAPAAEFQKFLNLVLSVAYPVLTTIQLTR